MSSITNCASTNSLGHRCNATIHHSGHTFMLIASVVNVLSVLKRTHCHRHTSALGVNKQDKQCKHNATCSWSMKRPSKQTAEQASERNRSCLDYCCPSDRFAMIKQIGSSVELDWPQFLHTNTGSRTRSDKIFIIKRRNTLRLTATAQSLSVSYKSRDMFYVPPDDTTCAHGKF